MATSPPACEQPQHNLAQRFRALFLPPSRGLFHRDKTVAQGRWYGLVFKNRSGTLLSTQSKLLQLDQLLPESSLEKSTYGVAGLAIPFACDVLEDPWHGAASNVDSAAFKELGELANTFTGYD